MLIRKRLVELTFSDAVGVKGYFHRHHEVTLRIAQVKEMLMAIKTFQSLLGVRQPQDLYCTDSRISDVQKAQTRCLEPEYD